MYYEFLSVQSPCERKLIANIVLQHTYSSKVAQPDQTLHQIYYCKILPKFKALLITNYSVNFCLVKLITLVINFSCWKRSKVIGERKCYLYTSPCNLNNLHLIFIAHNSVLVRIIFLTTTRLCEPASVRSRRVLLAIHDSLYVFAVFELVSKIKFCWCFYNYTSVSASDVTQQTSVFSNARFSSCILCS